MSNKEYGFKQIKYAEIDSDKIVVSCPGIQFGNGCVRVSCIREDFDGNVGVVFSKTDHGDIGADIPNLDGTFEDRALGSEYNPDYIMLFDNVGSIDVVIRYLQDARAGLGE